MPDRCIAARDMIVSMKALNLATESAAHYQPHDHLNPLATGFAQVFDMRQRAQPLRIGGQIVQEHGVEIAIDKPGARSARSC